MKTLLKSLLVAFTLTVVTFSVSQAASNKPIRPTKVAAFQTALFTTAEGKLQIAVDKETGGAVVVRLRNTAGTDLFVQQVGKRHQTARMRLDISALPDGLYQVVISNGLENVKYALTLATQEPRVPTRLIALK
ncbi:hypothetical protein GCM10028803_34160 [Larkinella knui]|uniref:Secretion system C-terminal sorting domain-containing protein n=1 Tax=Larkinella knui TaxID=2025310 RepID=A0A3P1CD58_9BACT|nr:hypothetical protein [Larkinella knui]RRB11293.1 hypothetical protein EHT87_22650 [Larkinella knui]